LAYNSASSQVADHWRSNHLLGAVFDLKSRNCKFCWNIRTRLCDLKTVMSSSINT
jgi:hypothetical protein